MHLVLAILFLSIYSLLNNQLVGLCKDKASEQLAAPSSCPPKTILSKTIFSQKDSFPNGSELIDKLFQEQSWLFPLDNPLNLKPTWLRIWSPPRKVLKIEKFGGYDQDKHVNVWQSTKHTDTLFGFFVKF